MGLQGHLDAFVHPLLVSQILQPLLAVLKPPVGVWVGPDSIPLAYHVLDELRIAVNRIRGASRGFRYLGIHSEAPVVVHGRSRGFLKLVSQGSKIRVRCFIALPGFRIGPIHQKGIRLHIDQENDRYLRVASMIDVHLSTESW
jgi:hypothetical protein